MALENVVYFFEGGVLAVNPSNSGHFFIGKEPLLRKFCDLLYQRES